MASLEIVYRHRRLVLLWSVVETFLFSAVINGWASLVLVLKQESYFFDLCDAGEMNATAIIASEGCARQDERLNLVFTVGVFTLSSSAFFSGSFIDHFGPRKSRWFSCLLFGISYLFFGLSDKERPYLIFPGVIFLATAGHTIFVTAIQIANMFDEWRSSVTSSLNGAMDSSAVVLLVFKLVHDAGVPLKWIYMFFFLFAITTILAFTHVLPSHTITTELLEHFSNKMRSEIPHENGNILEDTCPSNLETVGKNDGVNEKGSQKQSDEQETPLCEKQNMDSVANFMSREPMIVNTTPSLLKIIVRPEYLLLVMFLAVYNLRLWFYLGSLNSYLEYMSDGEIAIVNQYTNWFGIIQFSGFTFAPIVGFLMDWKLKRKKQESDVGFVIGFALTVIIALSLNILVLIPILHVQLASFVNAVVLKAFLFATYGSFILHKFPMVHYGKLYGIGEVCAAVFGCLQYLLFIVLGSFFEKDPFWINVGFLVLCLVPSALPIFIWLKETKNVGR